MGKIIKKIFIIILIIACLAISTYTVYLLYFNKNEMEDMYTSSDLVEVTLYDKEYNEVSNIERGIKLSSSSKLFTNNDKEYRLVNYDGEEYYILSNNLVTDYANSIKEENMYVRTPVTVYKDSESPDILGFLPKGSTLDVIGFDKLNKGIPNMYKIKYEETEGYVYSKYLNNNIDEAKKVYDEENTYAIHKDRNFSYELYGGYARDLDYYPYEKASFKDNVMPDETKTLYLNASVLGDIDDYISLAKESGINAFVIDIYDGYMAYASEVSKEYSISAFNSARWSIDEYKNIIKKVKDNDIYVIGRIVAFNNPHFARDNQRDAISYQINATAWVSAYSRKAWEYNVKLAIEAVENFGFNEIQYDYVRFPETSYSWSKDENYDFKNRYNESKGEAIQNFLFYATDKIHEVGAYVSADVFGEAAYRYVTAYGQYWPAISNIVDVISAMPYPDHFNKYDFGIRVPVWTVPYELVSAWSEYASERQKEIPTPAKVRTWVQAYDTIHEPYIRYGEKEVFDQVKALYDKGLNDGFITWNAASNISKYRSISGVFKKDYR
nr:hypothetical protein [Bacilli bacterium]